ncbi:MAG: GAF domain-containing sensor histidine kinase [Anaerolineae bacterium]|nr:GAF domain-containing sensor histidine kinase [Anaerolineae bacterium]
MISQLSIVSRVLQAVQESAPPEQCLARAVSLIARLTHWAGVTLFALCDEGTMLSVIASAGECVPTTEQKFPLMEGLVGEVWRSGKVCYRPNGAPSDSTVPPSAASLLLIPLKQEHQVRLLLQVATLDANHFRKNSQTFAEVLGGVLLMALRNARLYEALQGELTEPQQNESRFWATIRKTETLYRVSRMLNEFYQLEQSLQSVVNLVAAMLHAEQIILVALDLEERQVQQFVTAGPGADQLVQITYDELMEGPTGHVIREGTPLYQTKAELLALRPRQARFWYKGVALGPIAVVPLFSREQVLGVLIAVNREEQPDFTQQDVDLLMVIATQVAGALHHTQLFRAVQEERGRLHALVQSSRDGIILLGLNMHVMVINQPALWYLHLPGEPDTWVDQWFWDALSRLYEHSPEAVSAILSEVRRGQQGDESPGEGEFQIDTRYIHWLNLPVLGESHGVGRLFVLRDVTETRQLERFREDLMHTMVHDLRNPLSGIYAGLRLLSSDPSHSLSTSQHRIVTAAEQSTQRMLKLVGAILDVSRLESGLMPLNPTVFHVSDIVNDILSAEQSLAVQRGLELRLQRMEDEPLVWADRDLLERVVQNLIGNALKFTPEGGSVSVTFDFHIGCAEKLRVLVQDTGPGIPPEIQPRLFQKFVVGTHKARGSGLGLAFCRMVLEAHGERIWIESTSDHGTLVAFTLPLGGQKDLPTALGGYL